MMGKGWQCKCVCRNIGISPNLIHITWPRRMRIVPCRVVCYYKFNVKSGSKKMSEWGPRHPKWKHSSCFSVGQQMCWEDKARQEKLREIISNQTTQWSLFHLLVWYNWPSPASCYCIHQLLWLHISASLSFFLQKNSIYFRQSFTDAIFFLYLLWRKHM